MLLSISTLEDETNQFADEHARHHDYILRVQQVVEYRCYVDRWQPERQ